MPRNDTARLGVIGAIIAVICCVTPALLVLLVTAGTGGILGFQGSLTLPVTVVVLALLGCGLLLYWRRRGC